MTQVVEERRPETEMPAERALREERTRDRRALALLVSLVAFFVLMPILENDALGSLILILSLYAMLVTAILQLAALTGRRWWIAPTIILAAASMAFILLAHFVPTRPLLATGQCLLIVFFTLIGAGLFTILGQPGSITKGRLYVSVSVYLMLAVIWFAAFSLTETLHPGSFVMAGASGVGGIPRSLLLYLSLATLTTVGSGDMLPVAPMARMLATMEAVAGVLYVAITIARLVSAYHRRSPYA